MFPTGRALQANAGSRHREEVEEADANLLKTKGSPSIQLSAFADFLFFSFSRLLLYRICKS